MADRNNAKRASRVIYLYGITRSASATSVRAEGVDGASPVEPLACDGFECWISRVNADEYGKQLPERMEDLEWLATAGVRHQRVVAAIAARTEILPARFGTVFLTDKSLVQDVQARRRELTRAFRKIAGAEEWGVKVFAERRPAAAVSSSVKSGREYLKRKAEILETRARRELPAAIGDLAEALNSLAVDSAAVGKVSGGQPGLEWQASYLVAKKKRAEFQKILRKFAARLGDTHRIECTGPWPPYSFVAAGAHGG